MRVGGRESGRQEENGEVVLECGGEREREGRKEARGRGGGPCKEALGRREVQAEEGAGKV